MNSVNKILLSTIYVRALDGGDVFESLRERTFMDNDVLNERIDELVSLRMIENDSNTLRLTDIGRDTLNVVFAGGVFDIIHPGHVHTLLAAKALGDVLVMVIARNTTTVKSKGNVPIHDEKLRVELVSSLKFVDIAILGHDGDIFKTVEFVKPNIIALGYDQAHQEKYIIEECRKRGLNAQVVRLQSPMPDLKSSSIKKDLGQSFYKI